MSTHKSIDRICVAAVLLSLLTALLFMNGEALGIQSAGNAIGYENRLFDASRVHTIEIVIDDWDGFIETCQSEEYSACSVVIDGESCKNVGIRGKGNTSLSSVASMGSSRYSFKIEFDQYDSGKSYHGLDKLSLNNLIQDNTMMKDYLTYQMMNEFGVASPLCSFVYITVNGEDWGLYLAVEGVEEAFLRRNYGSDYGELYKPDSMSFGGGRGNGREFDINDFAAQPDGENEGGFGQPGQPGDMPDFGSFSPPAAPENDVPENSAGGGFGDGFSFASASDVKLQYIDDDPDSYANIFDNAKTDVSDTDRARLISSLRSLSGFEDLENVLDMDAVLRYFVVHSFVVNADSYTGSMIHNYYLYEEDGRLAMIPWDYNLAFGTFTGGAADSSVNDAIDNVLSDRPMQAWIFSDETYTRRYHELYSEFLNTVDIEQIIDDACMLIADYVEKDPTRFCTYEEFEAGVQTLKAFCSLRRESVNGQLEGTIPATDEAQNAGSAALVSAGDLDLSDMGTMNNGAGPGGGGDQGNRGRPGGNAQPPESGSVSGGDGDDARPDQRASNAESGQDGAPGEENDGQVNAAPVQPDIQRSEETPPLTEPFGSGNFSPPGGGWGDNFSPPDNQASSSPQQSGIILLGVSILALAAGLLIAFKSKR